MPHRCRAGFSNDIRFPNSASGVPHQYPDRLSIPEQRRISGELDNRFYPANNETMLKHGVRAGSMGDLSYPFVQDLNIEVPHIMCILSLFARYILMLLTPIKYLVPSVEIVSIA